VFAANLAKHVTEYDDHASALRVFLSEYAMVALAAGEPLLAVGLSVLSLDDSSGYHLQKEQAGYALAGVARAAAAVRRQKGGDLSDVIPEVAHVLMSRVAGAESAAQFTAPHTDPVRVADVSALSSRALCARLSSRLAGEATAAKERSGMTIAFDGVIRLLDLERLT
jgi:hypothetical protein